MRRNTVNIAYCAVATLLIAACTSEAQRHASDRIFDGLKGSVKSVVTHRADLKKKSAIWIEVNRRNAEAISYDANGQRTTWKTYDYQTGSLFESVVYKVIDGEKASIYDEVKGGIQVIGTPTAAKPSKSPPHPPDPRYDYKLKYKYDADGNVTEEAWYANDGSLWLRYTYSVKNNEILELVYTGEGELDQKVLHKFDKSGNEVEAVFYDTEKDSIEEKVTYEVLASDAKGNWTKRRESAGDVENRFVIMPREMTYRTITYF